MNGRKVLDKMSDDDDCDYMNVPAETPLSPEEAIIRRHRREKRDLQGTNYKTICTALDEFILAYYV